MKDDCSVVYVLYMDTDCKSCLRGGFPYFTLKMMSNSTFFFGINTVRCFSPIKVSCNDYTCNGM